MRNHSDPTTTKPKAHPSLPAIKLLASGEPLFIGHRGCRQLALENTVPSFQLALEAGADLVELDYRQSYDGKRPGAFRIVQVSWRTSRMRTI